MGIMWFPPTVTTDLLFGIARFTILATATKEWSFIKAHIVLVHFLLNLLQVVCY